MFQSPNGIFRGALHAIHRSHRGPFDLSCVALTLVSPASAMPPCLLPAPAQGCFLPLRPEKADLLRR